MKRRPSLTIQMICFPSIALAPWLWILGVRDLEMILGAVIFWSVLGVAAALWHRNVQGDF